MREGDEVRGFFVKYALTTGIVRAVGRLGKGKFIHVWVDRGEGRGTGLGMVGFVGSDFFQERGDAEAKAKLMARRQLQSLERRRRVLEELAERPRWYAPDGEEA